MTAVQLRFVSFIASLVSIAGIFVVLELSNRETEVLRRKYAEVSSDLRDTKEQLKLCSKRSQQSLMLQIFNQTEHELRECAESMAAVRRVVTNRLEDMQGLDICLRRAEKLYYEIVELRSECGCR